MKRFTAAAIMFTILISGCGTKTISRAPEIAYGNPDYKHLKDLPAYRYDPDADRPKPGKNLPKASALSVDEYEALGDAFLSRGNFYMAHTQYEKALEKNPENPNLIYKQGMVQLKAENPEDAIALFKQVLELQPNLASAMEGLGRAHFTAKNLKTAAMYFNQAVMYDPLLWQSYHYLGMIHDLNRDYPAAIKAYNTALTLRPDQGMILNNLGMSLSESGQIREAVEVFQQALVNGYSRATVYNNLGWALCGLERYEEAFTAFKLAGGIAVAYNNTGVGLLKHGHRDRAAAYFRKAVEESPRFYVTAHENLQKALKQR